MVEDGVTIVIVDDDAGHAELLRRNLRRSGVEHPTQALLDGSAALDYVFQRGDYAGSGRRGKLLLLLDINMPGSVDGVEVLRQLKTDPLTRQIPIVMLTTTDDPREIERCYELGCNVYVTKPTAPDAFVDTIARLGGLLAVARLPPADARRA
jgi:CheY-like chemotaxis protein